MSGVFISYRRGDSAGIAGRIYDRLSQALPHARIFMDVDGLKGGIDFVDQLDKQLNECSAMLVIIGPAWLNATDPNGRRRLDDEADFVRREVATALKRGIAVLPVLIDGTRMPVEQELPDLLAGLSRRHACELRNSRFAADMTGVEEAIVEHLPRRKTASVARTMALVVLTLAATAAGAFYWFDGTSRLVRVGLVATGSLEPSGKRAMDAPEPPDVERAARQERDRRSRLWMARVTPEAAALFDEAYRLERFPGNSPERARARELYEAAAVLGHPMAMSNLGVHFQNALGGPVDLSKAFEWYQRAADAGVPAGLNNLGLMYRHGVGVKQDLDKAFVLFERASESGHALAMNTLGQLHASGLGTARSPEKARLWFERSAEEGNATGQLNFAIFLSKGWGGPAEPRRAAVLWLTSAKSSELARKELRETTVNFTTETRKAVQQELADSGLYGGPIDGVWSAATLAAIDRWLEKHQKKSP